MLQSFLAFIYICTLPNAHNFQKHSLKTQKCMAVLNYYFVVILGQILR